MFAKLFDKWAESRQRKEISAFVGNLCAMDSDEIGLVMACATDWRHKIADEGFDLLKPASCLLVDPVLTFRLSRNIQELQRSGKPHLASGLMVWVHTLRATSRLELRALGRAMWRELGRGFSKVEASAAGAGRLLGAWFDTDGYDRFPDGLTPEQT